MLVMLMISGGFVLLAGGMLMGMFLMFVVHLVVATVMRLVVILGVSAFCLLPFAFLSLSLFLGMAAEQIKTFHVDEQGPVVGRAGWLKNADHRKGIVL